MAIKTILVCDDEPHIVHVVAAKLRNGGYEVITASDGEEALALAMQHVPDLIFTDYQMPALSGLELCARLRTCPKTRSIPTVMLTARGFQMNPHDLHENNVRKVLAKPFSPREILSTAKEILEGAGCAVTH